MTIQNKEQNEQIIAVLNYLKNLQSLLAKKNLNIKGDSENCKKFEDFRPIDKTMTVWDLKNPDDDVILSVALENRRVPGNPRFLRLSKTGLPRPEKTESRLKYKMAMARQRFSSGATIQNVRPRMTPG